MNPFIVAVIAALSRMTRRCPKCGKEQVVKSSKRTDTIPCRFCGAPIPPVKQ